MQTHVLTLRAVFLALVVLALLPACTPAPTPSPTATPRPTPAPTEPPVPTDTPAPTDTDTPPPTDTVAPSPTPAPTDPPAAADPGSYTPITTAEEMFDLFVEEGDIYSALFTLVVGATGRLAGGDCDLMPCAMRVLQTTPTADAAPILWNEYLYFFPTYDQRDEIMAERRQAVRDAGATEIAPPPDADLPDGTLIFGQEDALALVTFSGPMVIFMQGQHGTLDQETAVKILAALAEVQVAKLRAAGY